VNPSNLRTVARLTIPADPQNLVVCRLALAAVGGALPLSDQALDDLKLVTSEMCSNAIAHGYDGAEGEIELEFRVSQREVELVVSDQGQGFAYPSDQLKPGIGLTLLDKLCSRHAITSGVERGTTVVFAYPLAT
jgi:anti-sigma regulatory factor (Ser/Thr protein kinase)